MGRRLVVEADGAARGNPGPASYGAVVRDAETGEVLAERAATLGVTTNNVAEYSGLIAALEAAYGLDPTAQVEVRMDSKLVIEQMAGRWGVKHENLKPLASRARALIPAQVEVRWTWIPRAENSHADRLANGALDGALDGAPPAAEQTGEIRVISAQPLSKEVALETGPPPKIIGWATDLGHVTTLRLLRHGETPHTIEKRFSGTRFDPPLSERGQGQARAAADHIASLGGTDVIVASPLTRARQTAQAVADVLGLEVLIDEDLRECDFGDWDGLTFAEASAQAGVALSQWLGTPEMAPPGGESMVQLAARVAEAQLRILSAHVGKNVLIVAHVGSIKMLVREALGAPISTIHRLQLAPASLCTVRWYADGNSAMHAFNETSYLGEWARVDGS
ncbi:bifunctional RNase H/acid phosphatase [Sporichthya sp.]|uniref:bifunctional RNase H/acid phosphatase n=1 Tax=Sporichthya sp. TaxID=65475 RepID=UPI00182F23E3|nr:bifunctional RNase H/acid phosphatase [Sporichthya sp.]MBA3742374.1 bifunctional RNase H/acid phosphatase [Sporichthya sp.]